MILQALATYYERLAAEGGVAPQGFKRIEIPFIIVLNIHGEFVGLQPTHLQSGKKMVAKSFLVPEERGRSGSKAWQTANLLWDHYGYVLGWPKSDNEKDKEMAKKQHETFVLETKKIASLCPEDKAVQAVNQFVSSEKYQTVFNHPYWKDCVKIVGCNLTFQIENQRELVCQGESIKTIISKTHGVEDKDGDADSLGEMEGVCLVSGTTGPIARLHPRTPIAGAKSSAKLVSFQKNMGFDSYGKSQSFNAPTSKGAAFAYTTALNEMLSKKSWQKLLVGDTSTVFWAEKKNALEDVFADIFGAPGKENPDQANMAIRVLYKAPKAGVPPPTDDYTPFFVLGLAPTAARIAVRFWHAGTVRETARHILQHFEDCKIIRSPTQPENLSLSRLLVSTALQAKPENIPPNLAGEFIRAILAGTSYPKTLLAAVIRRCRAEREITYPRAALLKAILARAARIRNQPEQEVGMALDTGNPNIGYRLGRLFATLEKIQEEASPGINTTIRDRFYGAASGTPVAAFPHLMKLKNHHLAKLNNRGRIVNLEKVIGEIMDGIVDFPTHLSLQDQGRFAVGYYHQRQSFFTSNVTN